MKISQSAMNKASSFVAPGINVRIFDALSGRFLETQPMSYVNNQFLTNPNTTYPTAQSDQGEVGTLVANGAARKPLNGNEGGFTSNLLEHIVLENSNKKLNKNNPNLHGKMNAIFTSVQNVSHLTKSNNFPNFLSKNMNLVLTHTNQQKRPRHH